ncbi:DUF6148 family protein [uncultured Dysosmobacter sp.]|uniref:DUF6148 family protein n=1 Tax=uncultured Dysosmobacter sp. TaxID=2591384 RepID=UPI0026295ABA|nr:DUF6148 family protein [uncultured Dysosmobacter sp.]
MAVFSKKLCETKLQIWLDAEEAVATGQSYQIGTRMLTRADLKQIREEMEYWAGKLAEAEAEEASGGRNRAYRFVIRDV